MVLLGVELVLLTPKIWSMLYIVLGLISSAITLDCAIFNPKKNNTTKKNFHNKSTCMCNTL